jgi:metal-responsive CopG/Arc/MetJ family transcriptional regulator
MKKTASFQIDETLLSRLDEVASHSAKNRSELIRRLIEKLIAESPLATTPEELGPALATNG